MQRGDTLDISAELVDARDNSHIWGQQYSRKVIGHFRIARRVGEGNHRHAADASDWRR